MTQPLQAPLAQPGRQTVACPACDCATYRLDRQARVWVGGKPTAEAFDIVRCDSCGLAYVNPRPAPESLSRYYPEDYACYEVRRLGQVHGLDGLIMRCAYGSPSVQPGIAGRAMAGLVSLVRSPEQAGFGVAWRGEGRLLDFGCGQGTFLRRMHELGWQAEGIDFSPHAVAALKGSGIPAHEGSLPHRDLTGRTFDVITMRQALEHVPQPMQVLAAARELLSADGLLVIQVPNYAWWDGRDFNDGSLLVDVPRHLLHFTPATLRNVLARAGFRVLKLTTPCRGSWIVKDAKAARAEGKVIPVRFRAKPLRQWTTRKLEGQQRGNEIMAFAQPARV